MLEAVLNFLWARLFFIENSWHHDFRGRYWQSGALDYGRLRPEARQRFWQRAKLSGCNRNNVGGETEW